VVLILLSKHSGFSTLSNTVKANVWIYELNLLACTGVILWALSGKGVQVLRWSPVAYLGRISYSIYLIHTTMLIEFMAHTTLPVPLRVAAALAATVAYAALSWKFIEAPLQRGSKQHSGEMVRAL
jgi:peptidoglycan/LPS O-acetylase OafA/YrhL